MTADLFKMTRLKSEYLDSYAFSLVFLSVAFILTYFFFEILTVFVILPLLEQ